MAGSKVWYSAAAVPATRSPATPNSGFEFPILEYRFVPTARKPGGSRVGDFHFTPKHASWLNMVEIEIGVMVQQCLNRRIAEMDTLVTERAPASRGHDHERPRQIDVDCAKKSVSPTCPSASAAVCPSTKSIRAFGGVSHP